MTRLNQRGLTILELMIAMLLLAFALIGLAASFPLAMVGVATGGYQTTATLLAQQCIDIAKSIASEPNGYTTLPVSLPAVCPDGAVPGYAGFSRTVTVNVIAATLTEQRTQVDVVIRFSGGGGMNDTTLSTILAQ